MESERTIGQWIDELLKELERDKNDEKVDSKDKCRALFKDEYLAVLIELQNNHPLEYQQTIKRISEITGLGVKAIKDHVRKISSEAESREEAESCGDGCCGSDTNDEINDRIPEWIKEYHLKTVSDTERIYHYDHGVYLDDGETVLKERIEAEFGDETNDRLVKDIVGKVKRRTYVDRDLFNNKPIINIKNGLLDLETLSLQPHTPEYLSTAQLDVNYNPEASAPAIREFLIQVAQSKDIPLIEEIIGWLLWTDYNVHKAVMLLGIGRNGKGTLLRLITAFLGKRSISNVTLQELVGDRFAKADLYGKLANIGGDLPSKDLSDTSAFRNLTGGDDNRAQEKYRPAFNFRNKAKLLFSANVLPRSPDDTYAFYSRWILIEFLNVFDTQKGTADPDLDAKLQTPEELSGLLNIALEGLKRLKANRWMFSYDKTVENVEIMYKRNANPVYAFLLDECEPGDETDYIEKTAFWNRFNEYVKKHNLRPISITKFGKLLKDQTEIPISDFRPWVEHGPRPMCWQGVKFKTHPYWGPQPDSSFWGKDVSWENSPPEESENDSCDVQSRPSIVLPTPCLCEKENVDKNKKEESDKCKVRYSATLDGVDCDQRIAKTHKNDNNSEVNVNTPESCSQSDQEAASAHESGSRSAYGMKFECEGAA